MDNLKITSESQKGTKVKMTKTFGTISARNEQEDSYAISRRNG